jgi:hypothetical protein
MQSGGQRNKDQHREHGPGVHGGEHEQPSHFEFSFSTLRTLQKRPLISARIITAEQGSDIRQSFSLENKVRLE